MRFAKNPSAPPACTYYRKVCLISVFQVENRSPLPLLSALDYLTTWMAPASSRELLVVDITSHCVQRWDSRASAFPAATTRDGTRNETHLHSPPCRENLSTSRKRVLTNIKEEEERRKSLCSTQHMHLFACLSY